MAQDSAGSEVNVGDRVALFGKVTVVEDDKIIMECENGYVLSLPAKSALKVVDAASA